MKLIIISIAAISVIVYGLSLVYLGYLVWKIKRLVKEMDRLLDE